MSRIQDFLAVLRGAQIVTNAAVKYNEAIVSRVWANSSIKELLHTNVNALRECVSKGSKEPSKQLDQFESLLKESIERPYVVFEGVKQLVQAKKQVTINQEQQSNETQTVTVPSSNTEPRLDATDIDISSITLKELKELIAKKNKQKKYRSRAEIVESPLVTKKSSIEGEKGERIARPALEVGKVSMHNSNPQSSREVPRTSSYSQEHINAEETYVENMMRAIAGKPQRNNSTIATAKDHHHTKEEDAEIKLPELSSLAKQRKVPSSRVGRMASFGSLFAGLGIGTVSELTKGALGLGGSQSVKEAFLSPANAERIVDTLCKVRGAALKLGQILSIQDSSVVSPELVKAFERVRQAADYMPDWQVNQVMTTELGSDWRKHLKNFEDKPFAAASIGQVHRGILNDDTEVAIKIQYPGVAKGIESDIDNLVGMMKIWDVFPKGFFIDNVVKVAKRELNWEVDYTREAEYTEKFGEMISNYKEYYVPKVIKHMTTKSVLTTELVPGVPLDKCFNLSYEQRYFIGESVLKLCLRELFEFQCMQTDPNWSNFLYDSNSKRIMLIDFGSTRFYNKDFINNYKNVIIAAANNDADTILNISRKMGFLTGYETKQMEEAHSSAVMILGEIFQYDGEFDFGKQNTTKRIAQVIPTMVAHRLCPPPEEIYSIHRKLSGIFLLCSRLSIKMNCKPFYDEIVLKNAEV